MTADRQIRLWKSAVGAALLVLVPAAARPQVAGNERVLPASATLPVSNEAMLLSSRAEDAVRRGDFRLAIEITEQIAQLPEQLVAAPASRTYYPVQRQAARLLRQFPDEGVRVYQRLYDAEVGAQFEQAAQDADLVAMHALFQRHRLSSRWTEIGRELAAHLLDRGRFGDAIEVILEMSAAAGPQDPNRQAQLVIALAKVGAVRSAEDILATLTSNEKLLAQPDRARRIRLLERWFAACGSAVRARETGGRRFAPAIASGQAWSQPLLESQRPDEFDASRDLIAAIDDLRRVPLHTAVIAEQTLVLRLRGTIWAFDALTLTPRWHAREFVSPRDLVSLDESAFRAGRGEPDRSGAARLSRDARLLLTHGLRHTLAAGLGGVYSIERLALNESETSGGRPTFRRSTNLLTPNELVARDLKSGRLLWRSGQDPNSPLHGVAFQDAPIVVGEHLVVPVQRADDLCLCVLDPTDGALVREVSLVGPPMRFPPAGGRCLLATDETTIYACTGNGVVAAVSRNNFTWKWATVYPSSLGAHLGRLWWQPAEIPPDSPIDRPVLAEELLIVAPVDSSDLFAFDRFSGRQRWRVKRGGHAFVAGAVDGGLIVGGDAIVCLDLADGKTLRWRSVPLEITGRPAIRDNRVFVPTRVGVVIIDGRTGKIIFDPAPPRPRAESTLAAAPGAEPDSADAAGPAVRDLSANLLATADALFSIRPDRIVKYPDLRSQRDRCQAALARDPQDERAALALVWLDVLSGAHERALERLESVRPADAALAATRERLLSQVFVALAGRAQSGEDRLAWLHRAETHSKSPATAARLAVLIGRALEQSEAWPAALAHYCDLLLEDPGEQTPDSADAELSTAAWLLAVRRIGAILPRVAPDAAERTLADLASRAENSPNAPILLQRARLALGKHALRERVDRALTMQRLPPELLIGYLPAGDDPALPMPLRRRLHLERWETHAALGLIEQAHADGVVWRERFASGPTSGSEPPPVEGLAPESVPGRINLIETALRKLGAAQATPFTAQFSQSPRWKVVGAELIVDQRRPLTGIGPWILLRDLENRRVELHSTIKLPTSQRSHDDALAQGPAAEAARAAGVADIFGRSNTWEAPPRVTWPVARHGHLAAVPVAGGLICVGLGPERRAGSRLWEFAVGSWTTIPRDFSDKSAAGPQAVYFAPRDDRVVALGWFDGRPRWRRDLPGMKIARLHQVGANLIIVGTERQVLVVDASHGRRLRRLPTEAGTPRAVDVVGGIIVVWGDDWVAGVQPETLERLWTRPIDAVAARVPIAGRDWIAASTRSARENWSVIDVRSGKLAFERTIDNVPVITAAAVSDGLLLLAGSIPISDPTDELAPVRLAAFDAKSGREIWRSQIQHAAPLNVTQLAAHPTHIPLLVRNPGVGERDTRELRALAVRLIEKATGVPTAPTPLPRRVHRRDAGCGLYMLVTPTRMIVQAAGNVIAFGDSPLSREP